MSTERIGYTCAYTPLPLLHAAGFIPHRVLPTSAPQIPDLAGAYLHDNLCPHVKRVLDRVLAGDLPDDLTGLVIVNSCDAMRRLADALVGRSAAQVALVELPVCGGPAAVEFLTIELEQLQTRLCAWSGLPPSEDRLRQSIALYDELAGALDRLRERAIDGRLDGGFGALQASVNRAVTRPPEESLAELRRMPQQGGQGRRGVPIYLFGNLLADVEALELIESCGARVAGEDVCTGSRQLTGLGPAPDGPLLPWLADRMLARPPCARTLPERGGSELAALVVQGARRCGARGVVAHVLKFCDPYLARLPRVRQALRDASLPLLVLEGDCTLRSLGQHRTRIEAFIEMLD